MLHSPEANERACSTEARLAVDGNRGALAGEVTFHGLHELLDDVVGWAGSVHKEQIVVSDAGVFEEVLLVFDLVETDDAAYADVLEDVDVLVRVMSIPVVAVPRLDRAHEGSKFARNNPVEVTILDTLVVLVFLHVERLEVVPAEANGSFEALQGVEQGAVVEAAALRGVAVVLEAGHVSTELFVSLLGGHLEDDDHEGAHEERSVDHLVAGLGGAAVVEDAVLRVRLVAEESGELTAVAVNHGKVERAEVLVEGEVAQIIIDVEEECVLEILWRLEIRHPV